MEYSIGDVSALLNLSRDMIRYYEKQGSIHSKRNEKNNYRIYDTMDVFWLLEAIQHRSWGISIGDISDLRMSEYAVGTERYLAQAAQSLEKEAEYKLMLASRLRQIRSRIAVSMANVGNFWVMEQPETYRCHLVTGRGDEYERINMSQEASRLVFSNENLPFFDSGLTVRDEEAEWEMVIEKQYADGLGLRLPDDFSFVPASVCLCTHVDLGEIGRFDNSQLRVLDAWARRHSFTPKAGESVRGILLGRGVENDSFHRIVRLCLPIKI